jgi:hypothetical protein
MPTSKTRKKTDRPARPPVTAENAMQVATLSLVQASFEIVREAELRIGVAARTGDQQKVDAALEEHLYLRASSLGLLVAYSQMAGLPDPRENSIR